uniref:Uncharacterized protein n=1 Tax=Caenorhabditis japonica TaxID=281687 RepID=A0A8R1DGA4_CAEJA
MDLFRFISDFSDRKSEFHRKSEFRRKSEREFEISEFRRKFGKKNENSEFRRNIGRENYKIGNFRRNSEEEFSFPRKPVRECLLFTGCLFGALQRFKSFPIVERSKPG